MNNINTIATLLLLLTLGCNKSIKKDTNSTNNAKDRTSISGSIEVLKLIDKKSTLIRVPDNIFKKSIDLSTLLKDINYTPLETSDECIIGAVNKILSDSDSYFIHDKENNKIFRFNYDGKYLNTIGRQGDGPNEFNEAYDVAICKNNKTIVVLDLTGRKILTYDYTGEYKVSEKMKFLYSQIECGSDFLVLKTGQAANDSNPQVASFELIISKQNQTPVLKAFPLSQGNYSYTTENPLRKFGEKIYYHSPFSNTVWPINVKENSIVEPILLKFGNKGWDNKILDKIPDDSEFRKLLKEYNYFSGNYIISDKYQFFEVRGSNRGAMLFQDKTSKNIICGNSVKNAKSRLYSILFSEPKWLRDDQMFITIKQPYELIQWKDYILEGNHKLKEESISFLNKVSVTDNPIIVTYTLNNF